MKCCVSTDIGTWTNWLTFEPDPDYSPDAGTGLLSPISFALQREILLRRENPTYRYWAPVAAATRGFKMVLFTASRGNNFVVGTCAPPSALLVLNHFAGRPSIHSGYCSPDTPTFAEQCATVDKQLFNNICHNENHVLYSLLPPPSTASQNYRLRPRAHSQQLPQHTVHLTDSNFITRMLFTDIY